MTSSILTRIVTIHRQWSYLRRWIGSSDLFNDSRIAWIICNDAPDDPCPTDLRAELSARHVTLLEPAFNLGRSEARNQGARLATSPWLEFIDGDDIPLPVDAAWLADVSPDRLLHYPHQTYALKNDKIEVAPVLEPPHPFFWDIGLIRRLPIIHCRPACLIFPATTFHATGGFDGRYDTCEDLHLLWKLDHTQIEVVNGPAAKQLYRIDHQPSCDAEVIGFYTQRLLRLGARQATNTRLIAAAADRQALRAVRALLTDYEAGEQPTPPHREDARRETRDLLWRARRLYLARARPTAMERMREATKLILGR